MLKLDAQTEIQRHAPSIWTSKYQGKYSAIAILALLGFVACAKGPIAAPGDSDGLYNSGIIGGTDSSGTEDFSKTIVGLVNVSEGSLCTASILSDSIVVTAAHCVDNASPSDLRVIFGTDLKSSSRVMRQVIGGIENAAFRTNGNSSKNTGDVAIVRFSGGLPAGYHAATVLKEESALQDGVSVLLAGYGISDGVEHTGGGILRFVTVQIKSAKFSESEVLLDQTNGKGACHGDSGGPAYVQVNGKWMLWGITSRGVNDPNNDCSVAAAYTSIPYYQGWINTGVTSLMKTSAKKPTKVASARPF